jgi:transmembrane sensor
MRHATPEFGIELTPMQGPPREDSGARAAEQASLWLERLERTLKQDEAASFREWLKTPLYREVIVKRCLQHHGPEILAVLGTLIPGDVESALLPPPSKRLPSMLAWLVAVCCVGFSTYVLLGGPPWVAFKVDHIARRLQETYRTPLGGRREVNLPDGAKIALNTATSVFVNYGPRMRDAALVRGEAMFDVPRHGARPFRLTVGARVVETEAARFNLRRLASANSEITVLAGVVRVLHPRASTKRTPAQLRDSVSYSYGESMVVAAEGGVLTPGWQALRRLERDEIETRLAWQGGSAAPPE